MVSAFHWLIFKGIFFQWSKHRYSLRSRRTEEAPTRNKPLFNNGQTKSTECRLFVLHWHPASSAVIAKHLRALRRAVLQYWRFIHYEKVFLWAIEEWTQETTTLYSSMLCKYFHENEIVFHSRNYKQVTIRFKQMPCRAFRTMDSEKQNHLNKLKKKSGRQQLSFFSKSLVISVIKLIVLKN